MKILLIGSGGREYTFAWKLRQSPLCTQLFIAPGNAGTAHLGQNVALQPNQFDHIQKFIVDEGIQLVIVGPEEPLVKGIYDVLKNAPATAQVPVIGPSMAAAQLEGSKAFAKQFMQRHGIPTAAYREFGRAELAEGLAYLAQHPLPIVLKADGLAAGKGVVICQGHAEAEAEFRAMLEGKFGPASQRVVVEAFLDGIEYSMFALTDGRDWQLLPIAKDYKRVGEGDSGPNTGGMGAISPVPFVDEALLQKSIQRIVQPTVSGIAAEGLDYVGFIFFGLISVGGEPYVIEYNCRMGDPETEVVFPRLKNDLVELCLAAAEGRVAGLRIEEDPRVASTVMLVSGGYPGDYAKGKPIGGLDGHEDVLVIHAGTAQQGQQVLTNGGRVLALTALADTMAEALAKSYRAAERIRFEGKNYRRDIGFDL